MLQDQPAQNYVAQMNRVVGQRTVVDARFGRMWGVFPTRYQKDVTPTDIAVRDIVRNTQFNAATEQSLNPNHRYQANATLSYFADQLGAGTHDFKMGTQLSWEKMQYDRIRNGDLTSRRTTACRCARRSPTHRSIPITACRPGPRSCRIDGSSAAQRSTTA